MDVVADRSLATHIRLRFKLARLAVPQVGVPADALIDDTLVNDFAFRSLECARLARREFFDKSVAGIRLPHLARNSLDARAIGVGDDVAVQKLAISGVLVKLIVLHVVEPVDAVLPRRIVVAHEQVAIVHPNVTEVNPARLASSEEIEDLRVIGEVGRRALPD